MQFLSFDAFRDCKSICILSALHNVQVHMCNICVFLKAHEACGPLEIDSALKTVQTLKSELQDAKMSVIDSQLKPLPGETVSAHRHLLCRVHLKDYTVQIENKQMRSQLCNLTSSFVCVLLLAQLEKCAQDLGSTSKAVGSSMAQLLTCAAQGNEHYTGEKSASEGEEVTEASVGC